MHTDGTCGCTLSHPASIQQLSSTPPSVRNMSKVDREIMMLESILDSRRAEQREAARMAALKSEVYVLQSLSDWRA